MKPEIAKLWVDALRSGDYKQTQSKLRKGNSFCCLGVLCNLHALAHLEIAAHQKLKHEYMGQDQELPDKVRIWAGLQGSIGEIEGQLSLAEKNDGGCGFREIADLIEKHVKTL